MDKELDSFLKDMQEAEEKPKPKKRKTKKEKETEKVQKAAEPKEPMLDFNRYFISTGKPPHHKAGMEAYLSERQLKGKKTKKAWDRLFQDY